MRDVQDVFAGFLEKRGLSLTRQRREILGVFLDAKRHLTVEGVYNIAKKKVVRAGYTTVFRTMKLLREAGIAKEVNLGGKIVKYERRYGHEHHDHLVCLECGSFVEALDPEIEKLQNKLCNKFDFTPRRHRMEIFGTCRRCRRRKHKP
ncbi:MAG: transcriptional repressor [Omnitrophica bacterium]|nr:transcriptional repressor [Candidatus Omnitrophota bacterium]